MIDGLHSAQSGLAAYGRKVSNNGHNIANSQSEDFEKSRIVLEAGEDGGVTTQVIKEKDLQNSSPAPVENITKSETSNVDLAQEIVEMTVAQRSFEANAVSLRTNEETLGTVLDILA